MKLNMLVYTYTFAPRVGGVETYVMLLARGLAASGQADAAATRQPKLADGVTWQRGIQVNGESTVTVATETPADRFDDTALPFRVVREPSLRTLWRLLREADVIHLAGPALLPLALGLARHKHVVIEHHGYQAVCPNGLLLYEPTKSACSGHFMARRYHRCLRCNAATVGWQMSLWKLLLTFLRRYLSRRAVVNAHVTTHVLRRLQLPRSLVIYHGVPDPIDQPRFAASSAASYRRVCFAYVGRLVSEKGLPLLLEAARRLKGKGYTFMLKFIGDGPERQRLEAMTAALDLLEEVVFTGFLSAEGLQAAVADVTAVVMPSVWEETAGLAAIEQMMRGRLVIAADIGGLTEIVGDAGLKFAPASATSLASCLEQVLKAPDLATELGKKARERALALFGEERMVAEHLDIYRRLVDRRNRSGGEGP